MARLPITRGSRKKPPSICCHVTGCPIRGSHWSDMVLKKSPISLAFSFKSFCSVFTKESFSGLISAGDAEAGLGWVTVTAAGGAKRLKSALTERTKRPFESPKNMLKAMPRMKRKRYGLR